MILNRSAINFSVSYKINIVMALKLLDSDLIVFPSSIGKSLQYVSHVLDQLSKF
jgi:hypothetical protein